MNKHIALFFVFLLSTMSLAGCFGGNDSNDSNDPEDIIQLIDKDNDGILNNMDLCPDTLPEFVSMVNVSGCYDKEAWEDDDGDGVMNKFDTCPETSNTTQVFLNGCSLDELDEDGDGVIDIYDECLGSDPLIPTLSNGCQAILEGEKIVTPIQPQLMRNYAFDSPVNPTLFAFNVGNGVERYGVNYGPFATQQGYQLVLGTLYNDSFDSPLGDEDLMLYFTGLTSIENLASYITSLDEKIGGYGGLFYNSSSGENQLNLVLEYYIWAVPDMHDMSLYSPPDATSQTSIVPCENPPSEKFDAIMPGEGIQQMSLYDLTGKVVIIEIGAEWCQPCKLLLERLNAFQNDMRALGIGTEQLEIISINMEDMDRNPVNISSALARQTNESLNFPMTGTVEFGHDYLEASNSWPTLVILAPNPAQNEGLVNIAHGKEIDIFDLFNSKAKLENLYSGEYAGSLCQGPDYDGDGRIDLFDEDIDGDGVLNFDDSFPYDESESFDLDGDGVGDNEDMDDDGDGIEDGLDMCPETNSLFANELTIFHDDGCADIDGDNYNETVDCDDQDSSMFSDRDGDSYCNEVDAFPDDPNEFSDLDGDGVGDFSDAFPFDPSEQFDQDFDGWGDNSDMCPSIPQEIPPDGFTEQSSQQEDSDGIFWTWGDEGCPDEDDDGFHQAEDCDDLDANLNPDIEEIEDGIDNNCNTYVDEGYLLTYIANTTFSKTQYGYQDNLQCQFEVFNPSGAPYELEVYLVVGSNGYGTGNINYNYYEHYDIHRSFDFSFLISGLNVGTGARGPTTCEVYLTSDYSMTTQSAETMVVGYAQVSTSQPTIEEVEETCKCNGPTSLTDFDGDMWDVVGYEWWLDGSLLANENGLFVSEGNHYMGNFECAIIYEDTIDGYQITTQLSEPEMLYVP